MLKALRFLLIFLAIILAAFVGSGDVEELILRDVSLFLGRKIIIKINHKSKRIENKKEENKTKLIIDNLQDFLNINKLQHFTTSRWYQTSYFDGFGVA
ncbi:hypothetical protein [Carboxydothermus ferrireducens]|uniref:Uncharacterized protein n=1 Tax=Carboxydothermus ferrireducens DSM 11255 TaxID=1119529 RepID=A0ABX2R969_9THEO|nr:hypothetical protein [Carboxydothermus ferrireducens]NYE57474.1 hypothetical protein [Carboxydothermus ferrireducens DSM 11255]